MAAALILAPLAVGAEQAARKSSEELQRNADAAMALGQSADGISKAQDLLDYAVLLHGEGNDHKAQKYLEEGLRRKPWALAEQLLYAKMLQRSGDTAEAERRAKFVVERAEDDTTQIAARRILGSAPDLALKPYGPVPGEGLALVLVPIGAVDKLLLIEATQYLHERLGIPVLVEEAHVMVPHAKRDAYAEYMGKARQGLKDSANDPSLMEELKRQGRTLSDLSDNDALESFVLKGVAASASAEKYRELCRNLDDLKKKGKQWDTDDLLKNLNDAVASQQRKGVLVMGITNLDIYTTKFNFLYSLCSGTHSVLSYCRYCAANTGEPPDRSRLMSRLRKLCLGNFGHLCNVERCSNPKCPLSFQMTIQEHDAKTEDYCPSCLRAVEATLGHPVKPSAVRAESK
jgi:predicted Zn-dependent protease